MKNGSHIFLTTQEVDQGLYFQECDFSYDYAFLTREHSRLFGNSDGRYLADSTPFFGLNIFWRRRLK